MMRSIPRRRSWKLLVAVTTLVLGACGAASKNAPSPAPTAHAARPAEARPDVPAPRRSAALLALPPAERGKAFVGLLAAHDFVTATELFGKEMLEALDATKLAEAWTGVEKKLGSFKAATGVELQERGALTAAVVRCQLARGMLDTRVVFDASGQISGLWFNPAPPPWQPPPYAKQDSFREEDVVVGEGDWATPGTLTFPVGEGRRPALILVHGSGPNDRDESSGPQRVFKDLAWGLASRGVVVLRYDKRTFAHRRELERVEQTFTQEQEYVEDALAAVSLLEKRPGVDPQRIFVLGHSEGGTVAPRIGLASKKISGLVVLAGGTRDFATVILDQYNYLFGLDGKIDAREQAAIDDMTKRVAPLQSPKLLDTTPASKLPFGIPPAYWKDRLAHDPVAQAKQYRRPILILQGERDYQVTLADFGGWKKGLGRRKQVTLQSYPRLNHHFIEGQGKSRPEEYDRPGNVAEEVIADVATWITRGKI